MLMKGKEKNFGIPPGKTGKAVQTEVISNNLLASINC